MYPCIWNNDPGIRSVFQGRHGSDGTDPSGVRGIIFNTKEDAMRCFTEALDSMREDEDA
jgi:hypothetical protein